MKINLFKHGSDEFIELLNESSIDFQRVHWPPGTIVAGPQTIEIITAISGLAVFPSVASVIVQWLKNRSSRKIIITTEDGKTINIEGYSLAEIVNLLRLANSIQVIQTKPDKEIDHQDT